MVKSVSGYLILKELIKKNKTAIKLEGRRGGGKELMARPISKFLRALSIHIDVCCMHTQSTNKNQNLTTITIIFPLLSSDMKVLLWVVLAVKLFHSPTQ